MAFVQKDMTFSLFKNNKKKGEKDPDYTGMLKLGGKEFHIASWINKSKSGTTYMSGTVKTEEQFNQVMQKVKSEKAGQRYGREQDSDIPF